MAVTPNGAPSKMNCCCPGAKGTKRQHLFPTCSSVTRLTENQHGFAKNTQLLCTLDNLYRSKAYKKSVVSQVRQDTEVYKTMLVGKIRITLPSCEAVKAQKVS